MIKHNFRKVYIFIIHTNINYNNQHIDLSVLCGRKVNIRYNKVLSLSFMGDLTIPVKKILQTNYVTRLQY